MLQQQIQETKVSTRNYLATMTVGAICTTQEAAEVEEPLVQIGTVVNSIKHIPVTLTR